MRTYVNFISFYCSYQSEKRILRIMQKIYHSFVCIWLTKLNYLKFLFTYFQSRRVTLKCISVIRPVPAGLLVLLVSCPLEEGAGLWTSKRFRTRLFTRTLVNLRDYKLKNYELELYKIKNKRQIQPFAAYPPEKYDWARRRWHFLEDGRQSLLPG